MRPLIPEGALGSAPPWEPGMDLMMSNQEELGLSHKGKKKKKTRDNSKG